MALIVGGAVASGLTFGGAAPLSGFMISAGAGLVMSGIGTMLAGPAIQGFATAEKNPVAPWNVVYGRKRVGGTLIYDYTFSAGNVAAAENTFRDMVFVLACHPCESVDELLFDQQRIQIGWDNGHTAENYSFSPLQQTIPIFDINRPASVNGSGFPGQTVTVILHTDIPLLADGDQVIIQQVGPGDETVNGKFPVNIVSRVGSVLTFTYVCGGPISHQTNVGNCLTAWADYGKKVYFEVLLGSQTLGQTFVGMENGTRQDGGSNIISAGGYPSNGGAWLPTCSAPGMTLAWLRLNYDATIFANGLPQISFHVSGKNNIWDPRTSTYGYSENAALCIADLLAEPTWGFRATYGATIPTAPLIAAANLCDSAVTLEAGGTEPMYALSGGFQLTTHKGDVLKNMLTACAGRLTDYGGQLIIWPGAYGLAEVYAGRAAGVSETVSGTSIYSLATGAFKWKPCVSVTDLYNGVKGTYISPVNNWQSADFPAYAQDATHGYGGSPLSYPLGDVNLAADGGVRRWLDIQLPFTISCPTAQRLAKIELMRRRQQGTGTFALNMAGYQFTPMDVCALDLPFLGWSGKLLEVLVVRPTVKQVKGVTLLGIEIDVQETDPSIYEWSIGEELSPAGYQQAITASTATPAPPTNFLLSSVSDDIIATWTAPQDAYVLNGGEVELEYQLVASPEGLWISLAKMDPTVTTATINNLVAGTQYNVQIRSVNAAGIPSAWVVGTPEEVSPLAPGPITVASPPIWAPGYEIPVVGDALFTLDGFGLAQTYSASGDGSAEVALQFFGTPPPAPFGLQMKVRWELVSGIFAQEAASVTTVDGTHGMVSFGGTGGTTNQFVGRVLSKLANPNSISYPVPIQDFTVTANDTAGNFTVTPDPTTVSSAAGDLFTLRTAPTAADATSYTDAFFFNLYNPGLTVSGNRSNLALVIAGKGAGQPPQRVVDNTGDKVTVSPGWDIIPDATSVIVLVQASPLLDLPVDLTAVSGTLIGSLPIANYLGWVLRVEGYPSYAGQLGPLESASFREIYLWGAQGTTLTVS